MPNDKHKKLYDKLVENGNCSTSYDDFTKKYSNEDRQRKLYDKLVENGNCNTSFNQFKSKYFSEELQPTTSQVTTSTQSATSQADKLVASSVASTPTDKVVEQQPAWGSTRPWKSNPTDDHGVMNEGEKGVLAQMQTPGRSSTDLFDLGAIKAQLDAAGGYSDSLGGNSNSAYTEKDKKEFFDREIKRQVEMHSAAMKQAPEQTMKVIERNVENEWHKKEIERENLIAKNAVIKDTYGYFDKKKIEELNNPKAGEEILANAQMLYASSRQGREDYEKLKSGKMSEEEWEKRYQEAYADYINYHTKDLGQRAVDDKIDAMLKELDTYNGEKVTDTFVSGDRIINVKENLGTTDAQVRVAKDLLYNDKKISEAVKEGDWQFVRGITRGVNDLSNWSGLYSAQQKLAILDVTDKYNKLVDKLGHEPTDEELHDNLSKEDIWLLDSMAVDAATQVYYGQYLSGAFKSGLTTGASIPFMIEFMIAPYGATDKAIANGVERAIVSVSKRILKKEGRNIARFTGKLLAPVLTPAVMTSTIDAPKVAAGTLERMAGQTDFGIDPKTNDINYRGVAFNEDGTSTQQELGEAAKNAALDVYFENFSERFAQPLKGAGKAGLRRVAAKNATVNRILNGATKGYNAISGNSLLRHAHFGNMVEENIEEMVGGTLKALCCSDQELEDVWSRDALVETFMGLLPMTVAGVVTSGAHTAYLNHHNKKNASAMETSSPDANLQDNGVEREPEHIEGTTIPQGAEDGNGAVEEKKLSKQQKAGKAIREQMAEFPESFDDNGKLKKSMLKCANRLADISRNKRSSVEEKSDMTNAAMQEFLNDCADIFLGCDESELTKEQKKFVLDIASQFARNSHNYDIRNKGMKLNEKFHFNDQESSSDTNDGAPAPTDGGNGGENNDPSNNGASKPEPHDLDNGGNEGGNGEDGNEGSAGNGEGGGNPTTDEETKKAEEEIKKEKITTADYDYVSAGNVHIRLPKGKAVLKENGNIDIQETLNTLENPLDLQYRVPGNVNEWTPLNTMNTNMLARIGMEKDLRTDARKKEDEKKAREKAKADAKALEEAKAEAEQKAKDVLPTNKKGELNFEKFNPHHWWLYLSQNEENPTEKATKLLKDWISNVIMLNNENKGAGFVQMAVNSNAIVRNNNNIDALMSEMGLNKEEAKAKRAEIEEQIAAEKAAKEAEAKAKKEAEQGEKKATTTEEKTNQISKMSPDKQCEELINEFGEEEGIEMIRDIVEKDILGAAENRAKVKSAKSAADKIVSNRRAKQLDEEVTAYIDFLESRGVSFDRVAAEEKAAEQFDTDIQKKVIEQHKAEKEAKIAFEAVRRKYVSAIESIRNTVRDILTQIDSLSDEVEIENETEKVNYAHSALVALDNIKANAQNATGNELLESSINAAEEIKKNCEGILDDFRTARNKQEVERKERINAENEAERKERKSKKNAADEAKEERKQKESDAKLALLNEKKETEKARKETEQARKQKIEEDIAAKKAKAESKEEKAKAEQTKDSSSTTTDNGSKKKKGKGSKEESSNDLNFDVLGRQKESNEDFIERCKQAFGERPKTDGKGKTKKLDIEANHRSNHIVFNILQNEHTIEKKNGFTIITCKVGDKEEKYVVLRNKAQDGVRTEYPAFIFADYDVVFGNENVDLHNRLLNQMRRQDCEITILNDKEGNNRAILLTYISNASTREKRGKIYTAVKVGNSTVGDVKFDNSGKISEGQSVSQYYVGKNPLRKITNTEILQEISNSEIKDKDGKVIHKGLAAYIRKAIVEGSGNYSFYDVITDGEKRNSFLRDLAVAQETGVYAEDEINAIILNFEAILNNVVAYARHQGIKLPKGISSKSIGTNKDGKVDTPAYFTIQEWKGKAFTKTYKVEDFVKQIEKVEEIGEKIEEQAKIKFPESNERSEISDEYIEETKKLIEQTVDGVSNEVEGLQGGGKELKLTDEEKNEISDKVHSLVSRVSKSNTARINLIEEQIANDKAKLEQGKPKAAMKFAGDRIKKNEEELEKLNAEESLRNDYIEKGLSDINDLLGQEEEKKELVKAEIISRLEELGVDIKNGNIVFVGDTLSVPATGRTLIENGELKGWYDINTKKIFINIKNIHSVHEYVRTAMHEQVGHFGLRSLLGEQYDGLCALVYENMSKSEKSEYSKYARKELENNEAYNKMSEEYKARAVRQTAADEYMAHLAENGCPRPRLSLWQKIRHFMRNAIEKLGIKHFDLSEYDIAVLLYESRKKVAGREFTKQEKKQLDEIKKRISDRLYRNEMNTISIGEEVTEGDKGNITYIGNAEESEKTIKEEEKAYKEELTKDLGFDMENPKVKNVMLGGTLTEWYDSRMHLRHVRNTLNEALGTIMEVKDDFFLKAGQIASRSTGKFFEFKYGVGKKFTSECKEFTDEIEEKILGKARSSKERREKAKKLRMLYMLAKDYDERVAIYRRTKAEWDLDNELGREHTTQIQFAGYYKERREWWRNMLELIKSDEYLGLSMDFINAGQFIDYVEETIGEKKVNAFWGRWNDCSQFIRDELHKHNVLTNAEYEAYNKRQFYVPQRGNNETDETKSFFDEPDMRSVMGSYNALKTAKGRSSVAADPVSQLYALAGSSFRDCFRQDALLALYNYTVVNKPDDKGVYDNMSKRNLIASEVLKGFGIDFSHSYKATFTDNKGETHEMKVTNATLEEKKELKDKVAKYESEYNELRDKYNKLTRFMQTTKKGSLDYDLAFEQRSEIKKKLEELKQTDKDGIPIGGKLVEAREKLNETYTYVAPSKLEGQVRFRLPETGEWVLLDCDKRNPVGKMIPSCFIGMPPKLGSKGFFKYPTALRKYLSQSFTTKNPLFAPKGFIRGIQSTVKLAYIANPKLGAAILRELAKGVWTNRSEVRFALTGKTNDPLLLEYFNMGGNNGLSSSFKDLEKIESDIEKDMYGRNFAQFVGHWLDKAAGYLGEVGETCLRFSVYKAAKSLGYSAEEAITISKECDVNYDRSGRQEGIAGGVASVVPFVNASIQATAAMYNAIDKNNFYGTGSTAARKGRAASVLAYNFLVKGFLMTLASYELMEAFSGDDDDKWVNRLFEIVNDAQSGKELTSVEQYDEMNRLEMLMYNYYRYTNITGLQYGNLKFPADQRDMYFGAGLGADLATLVKFGLWDSVDGADLAKRQLNDRFFSCISPISGFGMSDAPVVEMVATAMNINSSVRGFENDQAAYFTSPWRNADDWDIMISRGINNMINGGERYGKLNGEQFDISPEWIALFRSNLSNPLVRDVASLAYKSIQRGDVDFTDTQAYKNYWDATQKRFRKNEDQFVSYAYKKMSQYYDMSEKLDNAKKSFLELNNSETATQEEIREAEEEYYRMRDEYNRYLEAGGVSESFVKALSDKLRILDGYDVRKLGAKSLLTPSQYEGRLKEQYMKEGMSEDEAMKEVKELANKRDEYFMREIFPMVSQMTRFDRENEGKGDKIDIEDLKPVVKDLPSYK